MLEASALLAMLEGEASDFRIAQVRGLADSFRVTNVAVEDEIVRAKLLGIVPGVRVMSALGGSFAGVVVGFNFCSFGLITGNRYPVIVERDDGETFEYAISDLVLIEK